MRPLSRCLLITALCCAILPAQASPVDEQPPAILPLASEPSPRLVPYAPLPEPLARGVVIVQFRTEHFRVMPVFGKTASEVSPRIGHLHVTVDDGPATWAHTSEDPIIVVGLPAGPHRVKLELADPTHKILASELLTVTVPDVKAAPHRH